MTFWPFALVALGYLVTGAVLGGLFDVEDELPLWCIFWPFFVGFTLIVIVFTAPFEIGKWIRDKFKKED